MTNRTQLGFILALVLSLGVRQLPAGVIRIAVASNFANAMQEIANRFEMQTGHEVLLSVGSTGKHYAQIKHGAPFEAFFAADVSRPQLLETEGIGVPDSRFTYAIGKLVLWSPKPGMVDPEGHVLQRSDFHHLAIANPKLAPYGQAAQEVMQSRGVWDQLQRRIVRGENVNQSFHFAQSGNAELAFVALSKLKHANLTAQGSYWEPPQSLYRPVQQQALLLQDNPIAHQLMAFVKGHTARAIMQNHGYAHP